MISGIPISEETFVPAKRKLHDSCESAHILACTFPKSPCHDTGLSCMSAQVDLSVGIPIDIKKFFDMLSEVDIAKEGGRWQ